MQLLSYVMYPWMKNSPVKLLQCSLELTANVLWFGELNCFESNGCRLAAGSCFTACWSCFHIMLSLLHSMLLCIWCHTSAVQCFHSLNICWWFFNRFFSIVSSPLGPSIYSWHYILKVYQCLDFRNEYLAAPSNLHLFVYLLTNIWKIYNFTSPFS